MKKILCLFVLLLLISCISLVDNAYLLIVESQSEIDYKACLDITPEDGVISGKWSRSYHDEHKSYLRFSSFDPWSSIIIDSAYIYLFEWNNDDEDSTSRELANFDSYQGAIARVTLYNRNIRNGGAKIYFPPRAIDDVNVLYY